MGKSRRSRSRKSRRSRRRRAGASRGDMLTAQRMKNVDAVIAKGKIAKAQADTAFKATQQAKIGAQKAASAARVAGLPNICKNAFMKDSKKCKAAAAALAKGSSSANKGLSLVEKRKQQLRSAGLKIGGKRKRRRTKRRRKKKKVVVASAVPDVDANPDVADLDADAVKF